MRQLGFLSMLSAAALGPVSLGQIQVAVRDRGYPNDPLALLTGVVDVNAGNVVTISTQQIRDTIPHSSTGEWMVWVYDQASTTGAPSLDIGSIHIQATPGTIGLISLFVAPAPVVGATFAEPDFRENAFVPLTGFGARNLGSISADASIRSNIAAAIAVTGDVGLAAASPRDQIDIGAIYRLQVSGRPGATATERAGGNIYADVISNVSDAGAVVPGNKAIGIVTAYKSIQGNIEARGFGGDQQIASITAVRITGASTDPTVLGITGDILAEKGAIGKIFTTGKIGTSTSQRSRIRAGTGIEEIRAVSETALGMLLAKDFHADTVSNLRPSTFQVPVDGHLHRIETGGNYTGDIVAGVIRPPEYNPTTGPDFGVFVGGTMHGQVTVVEDVLAASIIASTFRQPINIGNYLKGAIIATAADGAIPWLSVGYVPTGGLNGFRGTQCAP